MPRLTRPPGVRGWTTIAASLIRHVRPAPLPPRADCALLQAADVDAGVQADSDAILLLDPSLLPATSAWPHTHAFAELPKVGWVRVPNAARRSLAPGAPVHTWEASAQLARE